MFVSKLIPLKTITKVNAMLKISTNIVLTVSNNNYNIIYIMNYYLTSAGKSFKIPFPNTKKGDLNSPTIF